MTWAVLVISFVMNTYGVFENKDDCMDAARDLVRQGVKATCIQTARARDIRNQP